MTLKEKAEQWCDTELEHSYADNSEQLTEDCVEAYIAGAKENGVQWHDLRKDTNDLPKDYGSVWTNKGSAYHDNDGWFDDYGHVEGVIAWREPKFEEDI